MLKGTKKQGDDWRKYVRTIPRLLFITKRNKMTAILMAIITVWVFRVRGIPAHDENYVITMRGRHWEESPGHFPFDDPTLPWDKRVDDLVSRLKLEEITEQMARGGRTTYAPGIDRLGIKPYPWGSECLRGDVKAGPATSFPQAIGLAASFSRQLLYDVSMATGLEVRAKYNNYSSHGYYGMHSSASCWSPVINIARDPRWGRNQETYGEDPFLTGELSVAFVRGLQGNHSRYVMANAGCKHYDAYGGPENIPESRHQFNAKVTESDLRNTFLPAFKKCTQAGSYSVMCSYNSVNGVPACANKFLLTDVLRDEWGFKGYVISDEGAIEDILSGHKYVDTREEAAAAAVLAGTNLEDGPRIKVPYFSAITDAVEQGKLNESVVREAVKPLFYTRMRLGLFDPPKLNPFSRLNVSTYVQSKEHRKLAITSALKTLVLIKNTDNVLPLRKPTSGRPFKKMAIVGPFSDNMWGIFGGYTPEPDPDYIYTPLRGLSELADVVSNEPGCSDSNPECLVYDHDKIQKAVTGADFVVVCLGTGAKIEDEGHDRSDIALPGHQLQLLQDAVKYANGKPVVLLLFNGGPLDIGWAIASPGVKVIMECFFPAQGTGQALYRMFINEGEWSNPAGRLPMTWPLSLDQYPAMTDYSMANRTYRYMNNDVMLPFGYGLSYTTFEYNSVSVTPRLHQADVLSVIVELTNTGKLDGEEVVQLYAVWPNKTLPSTPGHQLIGFDRLFVKSGERKTCSFKIPMEELVLWDEKQHRYVLIPGDYTLYVGGQQPNQKVRVKSNVLKATFHVTV